MIETPIQIAIFSGIVFLLLIIFFFILLRFEKAKFKFKPKTYRIGKKEKRAVLDQCGSEIVVFNKGQERMAQEYCDYLNKI